MSIPLVNLRRLHNVIGSEIRAAIDTAIDTAIDGTIDGAVGPGGSVYGFRVEAFEQEFAAYCNARHCVGVGSGLDALMLALSGLGIGPGDEVITTANGFIATALAIYHTGATPVLVDHDPKTYTLDPNLLAQAITPRTRAIVPVHLYGRPADIDAINAVAAETGLAVVEDASHAHGGRYKGQRCGGLTQAAVFDLSPGKNLGALGDAGALVTNNDNLAEWARAASNCGSRVQHRHAMPGWCSRLDDIQAAVLRAKLRHLDAFNAIRRRLADRYRALLASTDLVLPEQGDDIEHAYHLFVVRCAQRDSLLDHLRRKQIGAGLHYPVPIHRQEAMIGRCVVPRVPIQAESYADELLSLPMCPFLAPEEVERIAREVKAWMLGRHARRVRETSTTTIPRVKIAYCAPPSTTTIPAT